MKRKRSGWKKAPVHLLLFVLIANMALPFAANAQMELDPYRYPASAWPWPSASDEDSLTESRSITIGSFPEENPVAPKAREEGRMTPGIPDEIQVTPTVTAATYEVTVTTATYEEAGTVEKISAPRPNTIPSGDSDSIFATVSGDGRFVAFASSNKALVEGKTTSFSDIFMYDREYHIMKRITLSPAGEQANGNSFAPVISMDGRHVLFVSNATNLTPDAAGFDGTRLFLYSSDTGSIRLVGNGVISLQNKNATGDISYAISANGRYVAYSSSTPNGDPNDGNNRIDLFIADMWLGTKVRVTSQQLETETASKVSMSADGRYVAFETTQRDLVNNNRTQVAVYDRITGAVEVVSVSASGQQGDGNSKSPSISPDGRYVAFVSRAANLAGGADGSRYRVYVHDRWTDSTDIVPLDGTDIPANADMLAPSISAGGEYVAFHAKNGSDRNQVYVYQRSSGTTWQASVSQDGTPANLASGYASVSADGSCVVFHSDAVNLLPETEVNDFWSDIFVKRLPDFNGGDVPVWPSPSEAVVSQTGGTYAVLTWPHADGAAYYKISKDGAIADVTAGNRSLVTGLEPGRSYRLTVEPGNSYFRLGQPLEVTVNTLSAPEVTGPVPNGLPAVATDQYGTIGLTWQDPQDSDLFAVHVLWRKAGHTAFKQMPVNVGREKAEIPGLVNGTLYEVKVVFSDPDGNVAETPLIPVTTRSGPKIIRVSQSVDGWQGNSYSMDPHLSGDGKYVVFASGADNLVPNDRNGNTDIFLFDREKETLELISRGTDGASANGKSIQPRLSGNGRFIVFVSDANNLIPGETASSKVYVYDRDADHDGIFDEPGGTSVEAIFVAGESGRYEWPDISEDGSRVAFSLVQEDFFRRTRTDTVYVYDRNTGQYQMVARDLNQPSDRGSMVPSISGNGQYVAFQSPLSRELFDLNGVNDVYVFDMESGTVRLASRLAGGTYGASSSRPGISHDGRFIVFAYQRKQSPFFDIYLYDREKHSVELISKNAAGEPPNGHSYRANLTSNGRFVSFVSGADNLIPGTPGGNNFFMLDRDSGAMRIINKSYQDQIAFSAGSETRGNVSEDGKVAAFVSGSDKLVWNDVNGKDDIFVVETATDGTAPEWPQDSNLFLKSEGSREIVLGWTPAADPEGVAHYKLTYENGRELIVGGQQTETAVTGLLPDTSYRFQIWASNSSGMWTPGPSLEVRTLPSDGRNDPLRIDSARYVTPLSFKTLAMTGETVSLSMSGSPGSQAYAEIEYTINGTTNHRTVALNEESAGIYVGLFPLDEGISSVTSIVFKLEKGGKVAEKAAEGLPLAIGANITVRFDTDKPEFLQDAYLTLYSQQQKAVKGMKLSGEDSVTIRGLPASGDYVASLVSSEGVQLLPAGEYKGIEAVAGETRTVEVTPLFPATVNVKLVDQFGEDVPHAKVTLKDGNGNIIHTGTTLSNGQLPRNVIGLFSNAQVMVETPDTEMYTAVSSAFTLQPGFNELRLQLHKRVPVVLSGQVRDADGFLVEGAIVTVSQNVNGKSVARYAVTNAEGKYSLKAISGTATVKAALMNDSSSSPQQIVLSETGTNTADLTLDKTIDALIRVDLYTKHLGLDWFGPHELDWRTTVHFDVRTSHRKLNSSNPYFVRANPGETVRVCVNGYKSNLPGACADTVISEQKRGHVELRLEEQGGLVKGTAKASAGSISVAANLYRIVQNGRYYVDSASVGTSPFLLRAGEPGTYELELYAGSGAYAKRAFQLVQGEAKDLGEIELLPSGPFRRAAGTAVTFLSREAVPGGKIAVRTAFQNSGIVPAEQVKLLLEIPAGTSLVEDSVTLNGAAITPVILEGTGRFAVDVGSVPTLAGGVVQYLLNIDSGYAEKNIALSQQIEYALAGGAETVNEFLGEATIGIADITLEVPFRTGRTTLNVSGLAPIGSTVRVYDRELMLGEVQASEIGLWKMSVDLPVTGNESDHWLRAEAIRGTDRWMTEDVPVKYDGKHPEMIEMTMRQTDGRTVTFDPGLGVARFPFVFAPGKPLFFTIKFNRPDQVRNVRVSVGSKEVTAAPDANGDYTAILVSSQAGAISVRYDLERTFSPGVDAIPSAESLRSKLPSDVRNFVADRRQIHEGDFGNSFTASTTASVPYKGGKLEFDTVLSMVRTNQFQPSDADLERSAKTGLPVYDVTHNFHVSTNDYSFSISGYIPETVLENASSGAVLQMLLDAADPKRQLLAEMQPAPGKPAEVRTASVLNYIKVAFSGAMRWHGSGKLWTGIDSVYSIFDGMGVNGVLRELEDIVDDAADHCDYATYLYIRNEAEKIANLAMNYEVIKALMMIGSVVAGPSTFGLGTIAIFIATNCLGKVMDADVASRVDALKNFLQDKCNKKKKVADPDWIYDPSGYVYEVDPSNRIRDVKATIYYKDPGSGEWIEWDAEWYGQSNPVYTDGKGRYGWDVPEGLWRVIYEKEGFVTAESNELRVLPPHFDVNIPMKSLLPASVVFMSPIPGGHGIDLIFDRHVWVDTVNAHTIAVSAKDSGDPIDGTWSAVDTVPYEGKTVARHFRFAPDQPMEIGGIYAVSADRVIQTYNGVPMAQNYTGEFTVTAEDETAPNPVSDVKVHGDGTSIYLMWEDPSDPDFEHVTVSWKQQGATVQPLVKNVPKGTKWDVLTDLIPGAVYEITLQAVDTSGNASAHTLTASIGIPPKRPDITAPLPVSNLTVTEQGRVVLNWEDPTEEDLHHIVVIWGQEGSATSQSATVGKGVQQFVPSGLQADTVYEFTVIAVDNAGNESIGMTVSRRTPAAPAGGGTSPGGGPFIPPQEPDDEEQDGDAEVESVWIETDGGVYSLFDGDLQLSVPAGAFDERSEITVIRRPVVAGLPGAEWTVLSHMYTLQVTDGKSPSKPLNIDIRYDRDATDADPRKFGIYRNDPETNGGWLYAGGTVRIDDSRIDLETDQLGTFAVLLYLKTFRDLAGHWSRQDVEVLASRHIVHGTGPDAFQPDRAITRAEFTKLLMNVFGGKQAVGSSPVSFADVTPDQWYYEAVMEAAALGLVEGYDGKFRPYDNITREEAAVMLTRAIRSGNQPAVTPGTDPGRYEDWKDVSDWAAESVAHAVRMGWMQGTGPNTLAPKGLTTRAQAAVLVLRILNSLGHITSKE